MATPLEMTKSDSSYWDVVGRVANKRMSNPVKLPPVEDRVTATFFEGGDRVEIRLEKMGGKWQWYYVSGGAVGPEADTERKAINLAKKELAGFKMGAAGTGAREGNPLDDIEDFAAFSQIDAATESLHTMGEYTRLLPGWTTGEEITLSLNRHDDGDITAVVWNGETGEQIGPEVMVTRMGKDGGTDSEAIQDVIHYALHHYTLTGWEPGSDGYGPDEGEWREDNPAGKLTVDDIRVAKELGEMGQHDDPRGWDAVYVVDWSKTNADKRRGGIHAWKEDGQYLGQFTTHDRALAAGADVARIGRSYWFDYRGIGKRVENPASAVVWKILKQLRHHIDQVGHPRRGWNYVAWDENTLKVSRGFDGVLVHYDRGADLYNVRVYHASPAGHAPVWEDWVDGLNVEQMVDAVERTLAEKSHSNPARYELFYNDGGHGGPYLSLDQAIRRAKQLIAGSSSTTSITIHPYSATGIGGYGPAMIRVERDKVQALTDQADRLLHGAGVTGRDDAYRVNPESDLVECHRLGYRLGQVERTNKTSRRPATYESFAEKSIRWAGLRPPLMSDGVRTFIRGYEEGLRGRTQSNPSAGYDYRDKFDAFSAGKEFRTSGAYNETGVANARVARYGFNKWLNNQPKSVVKAKTRLMKEFMEGWAAGKRIEAREGNPASGAAAKYEEFHGVPSEEEVVVTEEVRYHGNLAGLGDLVEIVVKTPSGYKAVLDFDKSGTILCCSEDGKQLYLRGGDQAIDLAAIKMNGDEWIRDSMVLGKVLKMTYRTAKKFDDLQVLDYEHKLGEESGVRPELIYDVLNNQLSVAGGQYDVRPEGVVN